MHNGQQQPRAIGITRLQIVGLVYDYNIEVRGIRKFAVRGYLDLAHAVLVQSALPKTAFLVCKKAGRNDETKERTYATVSYPHDDGAAASHYEYQASY